MRGIFIVKIKRKVLFTKWIDLRNLPKRKPPRICLPLRKMD